MPVGFRHLAILVGFCVALPGLAEDSLQHRLQQTLPLLGHRNWIVIADSAYPYQTAPGIETVATNGSQLEVVREVLRAVGKTTHVRPVVYVDAELAHVPERLAPGIAEYREALSSLLGAGVTALPHGEIIAKLDEAGRTFHVLLLKTNLALPYTSVFIQLDCGYWSPEAEKELRAIMQAPKAGR